MTRATVLVVDDEEDVRRAISRILTRAGFEVLGASGGSAAVLALRSDSGIDVLVTDLEMPGLSGEELLTEVRETDPGLPIVVLSGRADPESMSEELGVGCLAKPFHPKELVDAVALAHGGRQKQQIR
jgi:DNA-binding NtrC family response regulator